MEFNHQIYGHCSVKDIEEWLKENPYSYEDNPELRISNLVDLLPESFSHYQTNYEIPIPKVFQKLNDLFYYFQYNKEYTLQIQTYAIIFLIRNLVSEEEYNELFIGQFKKMAFCSEISKNPEKLDVLRRMNYMNIVIDSQFVLAFFCTYRTLNPTSITQNEAIYEVIIAMMSIYGNGNINPELFNSTSDQLSSMIKLEKIGDVLECMFDNGYIPNNVDFNSEDVHCEICVFSRPENRENFNSVFTGIRDVKCICDLERALLPEYKMYFREKTLFSMMMKKMESHYIFPWSMRKDFTL